MSGDGRVVIDDHLALQVLTDLPGEQLAAVGADGLATTGLWYFRLCSAFRRPSPAGTLSRPVAGLSANGQARVRRALEALPPSIELVSLRELAWPAAELQAIHGEAGRPLSALMAEALAAAHHLGGGLAVSRDDVGPSLAAAAEADGVPFHVI
jgi:hypothetical protein